MQIKNFEEAMKNYCNYIKREACYRVNKKGIADALQKIEDSNICKDVASKIAEMVLEYNPEKD
ncbi:MAG: hypothetical protein ACK4OM_02660 [Alphaproteobacteria bacterium]